MELVMALGAKDIQRIVNHPTGKQKLHPHEYGLSLRESAAGTLTWQGKYTFEGRQHRIDYGCYPTVSLREAESAHDKTRLLLKEGQDPALDRPETQGNTVRWLCEQWWRIYACTHRKRPDEPRRDLDADIIPVIGHIKLAILDRRHVNQMTDKIVMRGASYRAGMMLALLRQICSWGVERGYLERNPTDGISKRNIVGRRRPGALGARKLSDPEIRAVWQGLPNCGLSVQAETGIKLLLVTGQRRGEICCARWENVHLDKRIWHIPVVDWRSTSVEDRKYLPDNKSDKPHRIPLSDLAIRLFRHLEEYSNGSPFVMPSIHPNRPMDPKVITRAVNRKQSEFMVDGIQIPRWTPHSLRKTFMTRAVALKIMPHIVELTVNHELPDMLQVYVQGADEEGLFQQQREALELWAAHIERVIS